MYRYMEYADHQKIEEMWADGKSPKEIAASLNVHLATVYGELKRGETGEYDKNQRRAYNAELAQRRLHESFKRRGKRAV